jgi:dethiobiotin synthetase
MKKIIVAGIGTEVGKTFISAILCEALEADYWKPVQAGDLHHSDTMKVKNLVSNPKSTFHAEAYRLNTPMSPHGAANIDGVTIKMNQLALPETKNHLVIEMAGGLLVPLTDDLLYIDWVKKSGLPVVLVSNYYLGSINHTLLSWEALHSRNIQVLGIIFNGDKNASTFDVILHQTKANCLLEVSKEENINAAIVRKYANQLSL